MKIKLYLRKGFVGLVFSFYAYIKLNQYLQVIRKVLMADILSNKLVS